jgi:carbon starvation protein CstA
MALFSWANQSISAIALWIGTVYLYKGKPLYHRINTSIFITSVLGSFLFYDPTIGFGLDIVTSDIIGIVIAVLITILFFVVMRKELQKNNE